MPPAEDFGTIFRRELLEFTPGRDIRPINQTERPEDYAAYVQTMAATGADPLAALCLSGGGIRSAAFALGVLQALSRFDALPLFHYLSTVSGGGYIGSWLTAWRHHAANAGGDAAVKAGLDQLRATGAEAPQIAALRADSNYLTPRYGLMSADTWAVLALIVRNLVLNWMVFGPLFLGVLLLPSVALSWIRLVQGVTWASWVYAGLAVVPALSATTSAVVGRWRREGEWLTTRQFVVRVLVPALFVAVFLTLAAAGSTLPSGGLTRPQRWLGVAAGATLYAASWGLGWLHWDSMANRAPKTAWWWLVDALAWTTAGGCAGAMLGFGLDLGAMLIAQGNETLLAVLGVQWCLLSVLIGELAFIGLTSFAPRGDMDREWLARAAGVLSAAAASWTALAAVALYSPTVLPWIAQKAWAWIPTLSLGTLSGAATLVLGGSGKSAAMPGSAQPANPLWTAAPSVAGVVFAVFLAAGLAWVDGLIAPWLEIVPWLPLPGWDKLTVAAALLVAFAYGASYLVNVNRFSLHAMYRNRLVRAFLGAAREPAVGDPEAMRPGADPFTGFAEADNLYLADLASSCPSRLLHVVNITLNVVATKRLAWQERRAESFTVTRLDCGNATVGYRPTKDYSGQPGLTLGTAMAISGAAVSPNMGYHSSPVVSFLLMLFNARLGWWLGNPGRAKYQSAGPQPGLAAELSELAGATTDTGDWVYLSDGGHFENLGLYEMVRRRCRTIVVIDAGADAHYSFEDLGNALRKVFIDQGVGVDFASFKLEPRSDPPVDGLYCAQATIHYPNGAPRGWLLYVKPGYHGDERIDIRNYASEHHDFPHETTLDQWFSESQFEAYRALGAHIMEEICAGQPTRPGPLNVVPIPDLKVFRNRAEAYIRRA
jgi:hypothetical protein